jgi:hypothetical protein
MARIDHPLFRVLGSEPLGSDPGNQKLGGLQAVMSSQGSLPVLRN